LCSTGRHANRPSSARGRTPGSDDENPQAFTVYRLTLNKLLTNLCGDEKHNALQQTRTILGSLVVLEAGLSVSTLSQLLNLSRSAITNMLNNLYPILKVPESPDSEVSLLLRSFYQFLTNPQRCSAEFLVDSKESHQNLALNCFRVMTLHLRVDICGLKDPGTKQCEIQHIDKLISPELQYSCLHWIDHLQNGGLFAMASEILVEFLTCHFLHWLEVLSIIKKSSQSVYAIKTLQEIHVRSCQLG
jgi:hypothetical protein